MTPDEATKLADLLRGEAEPLRRFGVTIFDVPWWRKRIQRYVMPRRYKLWWQSEVLARLDEEEASWTRY